MKSGCRAGGRAARRLSRVDSRRTPWRMGGERRGWGRGHLWRKGGIFCSYEMQETPRHPSVSKAVAATETGNCETIRIKKKTCGSRQSGNGAVGGAAHRGGSGLWSDTFQEHILHKLDFNKDIKIILSNLCYETYLLCCKLSSLSYPKKLTYLEKSLGFPSQTQAHITSPKQMLVSALQLSSEVHFDLASFTT